MQSAFAWISGIDGWNHGRNLVTPKTLLTVVFITLLSVASSALGQEADPILGLWNTPENKSKIEIFKCANKYCGRIAHLKEPNYPPDDKEGMAGQPKVDRNNRNSALRTRPLLGLQLMEGFIHSGGNVWEGGMIYDADNGKLYKCKMTLSSPNRLDVRGFIGFSLIGRTSIWTR